MLKWFEKAVHPFPDEQPKQPPQGLWAFTWHYTKPFRFLLFALLCTAAMIATIEVYMFQIIGTVVDWMQSSDPATFFETHGNDLILLALLILVVWPILSFIDSALEHQGLLGNFAMQIRWRAHRYLLRQSSAFFADDFSGRLATKVMQTALSVRDSIVSVTGLMVYVAIYFISALVIFLSNDLLLAAPLLLWFVTYILVMRYFLPRLRQVSEEQSDARSLMTGRVVDAYTNIQTVKMFSSNENEEHYARASMEHMLDSVYRQMRLVTLLDTSLVTLNAFMVCGTLAFGMYLWTLGEVSAGAIAVAGALSLRLQSMSQWFIWELARLFESIGTTQDGLNTIAQPIGVVDHTQNTLQVKDAAIEFRNVSFRYTADVGVINELSLHVKPGERIGLVGHSGAGKSTLVNLLLRLHDLDSGEILIDGQNIASVTQESLRDQIAMVTQDTSLLHRTVRENIAYGRPTATEAEILAAVKLAKANEFIEELVDHEGNRGLDAKVGERGVKLSGGQRQRIAIARVLLKNAPILILDEATSALDSEIEAAIQEQLAQMMVGKTVVAIAHRLSTIAQLDRLVVLAKGRIVEMGTHNELVTKGGIYARLWARQSGGFLPQDDQ